jgi:hypothetical protein
MTSAARVTAAGILALLHGRSPGRYRVGRAAVGHGLHDRGLLRPESAGTRETGEGGCASLGEARTSRTEGVDYVYVDGLPAVHFSGQAPFNCTPPAY